MKKSKMVDVFVYPVGAAPHMMSIPNTLPAMQGVVGGYIEAVYLNSEYVLYCNEEGLLLNLPFNQCVGHHRIHGQFFFTKHDAGNDSGAMISLSDEDVRKIRARLLHRDCVTPTHHMIY